MLKALFDASSPYFYVPPANRFVQEYIDGHRETTANSPRAESNSLGSLEFVDELDLEPRLRSCAPHVSILRDGDVEPNPGPGRSRVRQDPSHAQKGLPKGPRVERRSNDVTTKIIRTVDKGTLQTSTGGETSYNIVATLNDLPGVADFTSLYDAYRIDWIEVDIYPEVNTTQPNNSIGQSCYYSVLDYDSAPGLTSTLALQYSNLVVASAFRPFKRRYVPKAAMAVYSGAFTSFAESPNGLWIDVASSTVQHYGASFLFPAATSNIQAYQVVCTYGMSFRSAR